MAHQYSNNFDELAYVVGKDIKALNQKPEPRLTLTGNTLGIAGGNNVTLPIPDNVGHEIRGTGSPEGRITAEIGTTYVDVNVTNGALKWIKTTNSGNQGWEVLKGDTGWITLNSVSKVTIDGRTSFIKIRRVNNLVTYQFGGLQNDWFGFVRRDAPEFIKLENSNNRSVLVVPINGIPEGFRTESSYIGDIYKKSEFPQGVCYIAGKNNSNYIQLTFYSPISTYSDVDDLIVSPIFYVTDEAWPTTLP